MVAQKRRARGGPGQGWGQAHINHHGSQSPIEESEDMGTDSPMTNAVHSAAQSSSQGSIPTASSSTLIGRKKRGRNKCIEFMELCKSGPIHLEIKDGTQVAVGKRGGQYTRMVSKIVRDHCELHHASWCKVPPEQKAMLRNRLTSYVTLDMNRVKEILTLNGALQRSYTRLRNKLYNKHYKPFLKDDEEEGNEQGNEQGDDEGKAEARATVPDGIEVNAWLMICDLFDEKLWKVKSRRNKKNRRGLLTNHTAGSKPFITHHDEETKKTGVEPHWVEFCKKTHTKKSGSFVNPHCETLYNQMKDLIAEEGIDNTEEASIMTQVLGGPRFGHVKGMGYGVIPTPSSSRLRDVIHVDNHEECNQKMEAMQEKIDMLMAIVMPGRSVEDDSS